MKKPLIFVTNDDGVGAKGLWNLIDAARKIGRVLAVAPEYPQSGKSQSITMYEPLKLRRISKEEGFEVYGCTGTPADCVKMAFEHVLAGELPDITVSGINHGSNSATSILYSGTMGAAIEASFYKKPAIGFSLADESENADFSLASAYATDLIARVLSSEGVNDLCLNVNIPAIKLEELNGVRVCRQTKGYWKEEFITQQDPRGNELHWLMGNFVNEEPDAEDSDEWALNNNYIAIVPVTVDMTNYAQLDRLSKIIK